MCEWAHMHLQGLKVARAIDPQSDKGKTSSAGQGPSPLSTPDVEQGIPQLKTGKSSVRRGPAASLPTQATPPAPLPRPVSGQALAVTLRGEAKDEGGGQDIPEASSAIGASPWRRVVDHVQMIIGAPTVLSSSPSLSLPGLLGSECSEEPGKSPSLLAEASRKKVEARGRREYPKQLRRAGDGSSWSR